jgi:hypothetical protein
MRDMGWRTDARSRGNMELSACLLWEYRQRPVVILLPWRRGVSDV